MTDAPEQAALRDQCTVFLTGHGPVRPADLLASIPEDTVPDRYGDGDATSSWPWPRANPTPPPPGW
jgi:hypothetical protein